MKWIDVKTAGHVCDPGDKMYWVSGRITLTLLPLRSKNIFLSVTGFTIKMMQSKEIKTCFHNLCQHQRCFGDGDDILSYIILINVTWIIGVNFSNYCTPSPNTQHKGSCQVSNLIASLEVFSLSKKCQMLFFIVAQQDDGKQSDMTNLNDRTRVVSESYNKF